MKHNLRKYSTKWKTGILQAFVAIFLFTSSACDFDIPEKFEMPTWFLDIKIPLVQKRYEMGDLSNPDYNIFPTSDSMGFQIVYEAELPFTSLDPENLKIEFPGGFIEAVVPATEIPGVDRIVAIASGKGGVGKSTVSSNLACALAAQGRRVGLLDADVYGPSQPRMLGVSGRPSSPDGKIIIPLQNHGVTMMSIGLMTDEGQAVVWRGPMIMGALQQMMMPVSYTHLTLPTILLV